MSGLTIEQHNEVRYSGQLYNNKNSKLKQKENLCKGFQYIIGNRDRGCGFLQKYWAMSSQVLLCRFMRRGAT
jgi:hypothetical protein